MVLTSFRMNWWFRLILVAVLVLILPDDNKVLCDVGDVPVFVVPIAIVLVVIGVCFCCCKYCGTRQVVQGVVLTTPGVHETNVNVPMQQPGMQAYAQPQGYMPQNYPVHMISQPFYPQQYDQLPTAPPPPGFSPFVDGKPSTAPPPYS